MNQGRDDEHSGVYIPNDADHAISGSYQSESNPQENLMPSQSRRRLTRVFASLFVIVVVAASGYFLVAHFAKGSDADKLAGKVAMSASELRSVVVGNHLTVYWAGPTDGAKYVLLATRPGAIFVRYLPNGRGLADKTSTYRVIATYSLKDAFLITQSAGGVKGNVGFTNIDGNSVFYVKTRPTNVYMGIKGKDIQLEIFDPGTDQSLGLSLLHHQIQQIS